jgi:uncharacterized protein (TIGR03663 family)
MQGRFTSLLPPLTVGGLIWLAILLLAAVSRLWDLGSRALHHDESLHTYYSWVFSEGLGYTHHPMMHGPFLFHINALSYLLLGDSDTTSRITAAVFGIALVMTPWLLRGPALLGQWGAISASILLLVSPSILYYSRFIRHDIFAVFGAMLLFIAVIRYLEKPASRWIILAVAAVGFVLTTHEITFVNLAILAAFTGAFIAWRTLPAAIPLAIGAVILFFASRAALYAIGVDSPPEIPWQEPSTSQVVEYLLSSIIHPVIAAGIAIGVAFLVVVGWLLERRRPPGAGWIDGTLGQSAPETIAGRLATALRDSRAWGIGAIVGGSIFVVLYTSLFSNLGGLGTGTLGAVGYWLGQHGVQRGEQPWFYYLVLAPQYEFLAIAGAVTAGAFLIRYAWTRRDQNLELDRRFITLAMLSWWAAVMFLVLSWAGEKMPWLIIHFLLPMLLLAGGGVGLTIERLVRISPERRSTLTVQTIAWSGLITLLLALWLILLNWASAGPFLIVDDRLTRTIRDDVPLSWWLVYTPLVAAIALAALAIRQEGRRVGLGIAGVSFGVMLLLAQISAGWNLSFRDGDVPRDMLVYVQTSPDLHQTVEDLQLLSHELTGGMDLPVYYSGHVQWPLNWYLRDFNNRTLFHDVHDIPDAPIIMIAANQVGEAEEARLENYSFIDFPLRWWIPEDQTYRRFAIAPEVRTEWRQNLQTDDPPPYSVFDVVASIGRTAGSIREPEQQARLFRLIAHRELSASIGGYAMRIYIHDDYRRHFEGLRYGDPDRS